MAASDSYYGRTPEEWESLTAATVRFLGERARLRRTTTYTELNAVLMNRTGLRPFDFGQESERAAMGELLGRSVEQAAISLPGFDKLMISSLVIYLNGNDAGSGFYALAISKGLFSRGADKLAFWTEQLNGVHAYFAAR